jgi:hypothetical protein
MVDNLPRKHETLSTTSSTVKTKKKLGFEENIPFFKLDECPRLEVHFEAQLVEVVVVL